MLLALQGDKSAEAEAVRTGLGITSYIITSANDFQHTTELLKKAGVDEKFDFHY
jgi:hypothetical protein